MLKMIGWEVELRPRSECDGADPANLSKRYAFILPSTDGYIYCWNGSEWSKKDEPMFTFRSEFPKETDGFKHDRNDAMKRAGVRDRGVEGCPPYRFGIMTTEVPDGYDFPIETGAYARDERGIYESKDRRPS
jgi:hypothetical protein